MGIQHFSGLFVLLCMGVGGALLTLAGEHTFYHLVIPRLRRTHTLQYWLHTSQVSKCLLYLWQHGFMHTMQTHSGLKCTKTNCTLLNTCMMQVYMHTQRYALTHTHTHSKYSPVGEMSSPSMVNSYFAGNLRPLLLLLIITAKQLS